MTTDQPTLNAKRSGLETLMKRIDELNDAIAKRKAAKKDGVDDLKEVPWEVDWKSDDEMVESARQTIKVNWPIFERLSQL